VNRDAPDLRKTHTTRTALWPRNADYRTVTTIESANNDSTLSTIVVEPEAVFRRRKVELQGV
jgi:hypothetical protein